MNYLRALYEGTSMLLKYTIQNCDSTFEEAVSLFFYENRHTWKEDNEKKIVDVISIPSNFLRFELFDHIGIRKLLSVTNYIYAFVITGVLNGAPVNDEGIFFHQVSP